MHAAVEADDDFIFGHFPHHSLFEFSQQGFIVQVCKVLASASPLCCASVYVCVLICSLQVMEQLIGLSKAVVLHHQRSLEEVVVGGGSIFGSIPLDPFVPALLTCPKLSVLKLGRRGALSRANTLMVLEKLTSLQEFVLSSVSVDLRQGHPLAKVRMPKHCIIVVCCNCIIVTALLFC